MLDNRKIGELPEITGKMVKVRFGHTLCICIGQCLQGQTRINVFASKAVASALNSLQKLNPSEFQSIIRVVFHDRRLQYTEHQQLEGWRWNRPGDRILDLGEHRMKDLWCTLMVPQFLVLMYCVGLVCVERMLLCNLLCLLTLQ